MGWYIRKRVKLGPFMSLNLSKSGAGVSVGPRGFKVSLSPRGRMQLNAGRGGLYYRQSLGQVQPPAHPALPAPHFCRMCGGAISQGANYCGHCGAKI